MEDLVRRKGVLAWFARNHVAANLLMLMIVVGGSISLKNTTVEIFPDTAVDVITITVPYLGASPEEVEDGVLLRVEEAVAGIEGIKRLRSTAMEGSGTVMIEVEQGYDPTEVKDEVKAEVDQIITFPEETEKPIITEITTRYQVLTLAIYGDASEKTLKNIAEHMRDELTAKDIISQVEIIGARTYEISIEISEETLRQYGLSFDDISRAVGQSSLDLPGGQVKTKGGEILIRTQGQMYTGREFEKIVVLTRPDGTSILLGDIATVIDGFEDSDLISRFDGKPSVGLQIFRVGDQHLLEMTEVIKEYVDLQEQTLPEGVNIAVWFDRSEILKSRMQLLQKNGIFGLILVFIVLSLFLDLRLAFWTTMGIPISFMGAFWAMPYFDITINMMSLFAFILALGIVVDDAIVVGENIFTYRQKGMTAVEAAIQGVKEMAAPVVMAVLTTIFAFMPLLYIYGVFGKFIRVVPIIVISILAFSLIEALLILPAHLSGGKLASQKKAPGLIARIQNVIRVKLDSFVQNIFAPFVRHAVSWRYLTLSIAVAVLMVAIGYVKGGHMKFALLPKIDSDNVWVALAMPQGTTVQQTKQVVEKIEAAANEIRHEIDSQLHDQEHSLKTRLKHGIQRVFGIDSHIQSIFKHMQTTIGEQPFTRDSGVGPPQDSGYGANYAEVNIELVKGELRGEKWASSKIAQMWRDRVGEIPGVSSMTFASYLFSAGDAINVEMSHYNFDKLLEAVEVLKAELAKYGGVYDIKDSFETGKMELKLELTEQGRTLGLTLSDLARQVRQGFYGDEVQRVQRGRDDMRVMVRYPEEDRRSLADIENMRIRLPDGREIPFQYVAKVTMGRGYATISRAERRRVVSVTADVDQTIANANEINNDIRSIIVPKLSKDFPGLIFFFEGEQKEQKEIAKSLGSSALIALFAIFAILAVQFRSYLQPSIIMSAIPFGLVGALVGHIVMGFNLSILSIFGIVALTGIVVNDSLIMVDLINRERGEGIVLKQVIRDSVTRRFRPILLTTLTTFCGLVPMMLEKSLQARFLIPMAVSLAFGVLFATMITLIIVPSLYMILEDIRGVLGITAKESPQPLPVEQKIE